MDGGPLVILLAEDNDAHVKLVMRTLRDHPVANKLYCVGDGQAALDYLWRRSDFANEDDSPRPDLILLDLRLPKIDGLEVLRQIKSANELQSIPVAVLTTSEDEKDIAQAYGFHANSYLVKPVDFANFSDMMRDLGFYWLTWNRSPSS